MRSCQSKGGRRYTHTLSRSCCVRPSSEPRTPMRAGSTKSFRNSARTSRASWSRHTSGWMSITRACMSMSALPSARVVTAVLDVVHQAAHAAQPRLVGVPADVDRFRVDRLARRHRMDLDVDVQDQITHLLHPAQRHPVDPEGLADVELAAVAGAQIVGGPELLDERRSGRVVDHAIHAAAAELPHELRGDEREAPIGVPPPLLALVLAHLVDQFEVHDRQRLRFGGARRGAGEQRESDSRQIRPEPGCCACAHRRYGAAPRLAGAERTIAPPRLARHGAIAYDELRERADGSRSTGREQSRWRSGGARTVLREAGHNELYPVTG